ncbi:hypothetical protein THASP1DRAFT_29963 [Thamnocephalis sphaerospora]|uniref:Uncharacterized protein n=1 Tax=Thamnocephalis sphaerospora TaxID=78915 RepID=A0A4P9XRU5_9FUNG|nr:hypothetical protein THASP1DRAFT_29963 [Thamnocephalis sphaerospora]|eukprot:RKP08231.1 hypothetical protein THASP1DRAFT_29963 [Thamnocephalis sphaerospora]
MSMQRRSTYHGPNDGTSMSTSSLPHTVGNGVLGRVGSDACILWDLAHASPAPASGMASPPSPSPAAPGERSDLSLRDILERYANNEDMLRLVLTAKIEEDKRRREYSRALSEQALLERCKAELEMMRRNPHYAGMHPHGYVPEGPAGPPAQSLRGRPHDGSVQYTRRQSGPSFTTTASPSNGAAAAAHHANGHSHADRTPPTSLSTSSSGSSTNSSLPRPGATTTPDASGGDGYYNGSYTNGSTQSQRPPSFTDYLAFSPADVTQMPPLPLPAGMSGNHMPTRTLARSNSLGAPFPSGSANEESIASTLKKRRHDEVMRAVRERVLSKRRAQSMHEPEHTTPKALAHSGVTAGTQGVSVPETAPTVSAPSGAYDVRDHRSMTLPPLLGTNHASRPS